MTFIPWIHNINVVLSYLGIPNVSVYDPVILLLSYDEQWDYHAIGRNKEM